jgi:hypothetical protein
VETTVSQEAEVDCFGGRKGSTTSLSLLLGKVSHTRKTTPMLLLEEILEVFRHISPDHDHDLSGLAAQELRFMDDATSKVCELAVLLMPPCSASGPDRSVGLRQLAVSATKRVCTAPLIAVPSPVILNMLFSFL